MKKPNQYPITIERVLPARNAPNRPREVKTKKANRTATQNSSLTRPTRGPAKLLPPAALDTVLAYNAQQGRLPEANRVKILLSVYAGMRVSEIAQLRMADVTDASGRVGPLIQIRSETAKNKRARTIPMHPEVREAILAFRSALPGIEQFAVTRRNSRIQVQSIHSLTVWFHWIYKQAGLEGCSSHSGRRTFITELARVANNYGMSLRDVQILAGHARLDTTERYIEPSQNLSDLVASLGNEATHISGGTEA